MSADGATPAEAAEFADAVGALGRVRVPLDEVLALWSRAVPRLQAAPGSRAALRSVLDGLAGSGVLQLPSGSWETSGGIALPAFVTVPAARRASRGAPHLTYPWRPELGWVASLRTVGDVQMTQLRRINEWLTTAGSCPVVPHRVRSAEVLGDEKALDALAHGALFGEGRLSFELLRCERRPAPLPAAAVGPGPDILVVENSDPYWVAVDALRAARGHPVGAVVWGSGRTFPSQVGALGVDVAGRGPARGVVWYWGDLDPTGVRIAVDAERAAREAGVGPVRAPAELWAAHLRCPVTDAGNQDWDDTGAPWFGAGLWESLAPVRAARGRVSQEACATAAVADWITALTADPVRSRGGSAPR